MGGPNEHGYGKVSHSNRTYYAHREAYKVWNGVLEKELSVDHTCEVHCCINPMHLDKCTRGENTRRTRLRRIWCKAGKHLMRGDNIAYLKKGARAGWRMCRECTLDRNADWRTTNPAKVKAYVAADLSKNRDRRLADKRAHYVANRERICARQRDYERRKYWEDKNKRLNAELNGKA